jgi:hypothetical protein
MLVQWGVAVISGRYASAIDAGTDTPSVKPADDAHDDVTPVPAARG